MDVPHFVTRPHSYPHTLYFTIDKFKNPCIIVYIET